MSPGQGANPSLYKVQVLDRALAILDALALLRESASLAEIAAEVKLHKSSVHRLLMSLVRHRLVDRDSEDGRFSLGVRLFELGTIAIARFNIRDRARPYLERLMYNSHETVHLCVLDNGESLYVDKIEPDRTVRLSSTIGHRNGVHCTAAGKVMLAWLAESEVDAILQQHGMRCCTANTLTTPAELKAELKVIRERGYAIDNEEHEEGVRCVAAAVRDHSERPIAAMSVSAPSFRLPMEKIPAVAALVVETVLALSADCGYRPQEHSIEGMRATHVKAQAGREGL
jgi:DNA-binding IclR family transcriptional regulator